MELGIRSVKMFICICVLTSLSYPYAMAQSGSVGDVVASPEMIRYYTYSWQGERLEDGRPMVADELMERLKGVKVEDAWQFLHQRGYANQFEDGWKTLRNGDEVPVVGRALTAVYMPLRPDVQERLVDDGLKAGHEGVPITWPINLLQNNDVYVADNFGKVAYGTLIGDKLGNTIFSRTGTGVVFHGTVRDPETLVDIQGFNAFARAFHPTFSDGVMLMGINVPAQIGNVTVFPGDVILAKRMGVVVIPPQYVEEIVVTAEIVRLRDEFVHQRVREHVYTPGQVDARWTPDMESDFLGWLEEGRMDRLPVTLEEMQDFLQQRTW